MPDAPKQSPTSAPPPSPVEGTVSLLKVTLPKPRVLSAERASPLPAAPSRAQGDVKERLRDEAANQALNAVAMLRDTWSDFRRSDRFFKYKAAIVATWLLLSVAGIVVACPGSGERLSDNGLDAVLIAEPSRGEFMIRNESDETWTLVQVRVNGRFSHGVASVPPGGSLVFTPKQLKSVTGEPAPEDLRVNELTVQTSDDDAVLIRRGELVD